MSSSPDLKFILIPLCMWMSVILVNGQTPESLSDTLVIRSTSNFDITGRGTAAEWSTVDPILLTRRKGPATHTTTARLLYSETGLYVLFNCKDKKITATLREDFTELWKEDVVEIFLWTDLSTPIYFEYELSPLNYELPIIVPNLDGTFYGWRPWQYEGGRRVRHATHIVKDQNGNTREWIAEFFIPYELLKPLQNVPPKKGTVWRINLYRNDHDGEYTSWSWKPVETNYHDYERFGFVTFD